MFQATDTPWAPWFVVRSDDKKRARLNVVSHLLSQIPYTEAAARRSRHCQSAKRPGGYVEPNYPYKFVPELDWQ